MKASLTLPSSILRKQRQVRQIRSDEAGLWVVNRSSQNLLRFSSADLASSGTANIAPTTSLNNAGEFTTPHSMKFDSNGNLWVVNGDSGGGGGTLYGFTACQLSSLDTVPAPEPTFSLTPLIGGVNGFEAPLWAAFDTGGNLWVSDFLADRIFKFSAAQLSTTGAVDPAAVLVNSSPIAVLRSPVAFSGPMEIAFDSSGNLWAANFSNSTITEAAKSTLDAASGPASTPVVPSIVLEHSVFDDQIFNTIDGPEGMLFDAQGNLWFDNALCEVDTDTCTEPLGGSVVEFTASSITANDSPPADVLITSNPPSASPTSSLNLPIGISMDTTGNLFVANADNSSVAEYTTDQLVGLGNPVVPHLVITGEATGLNMPTDVVFQPTSAPFDGGNVAVTNGVNIESSRGATISGGTFQVTNTTNAYYAIASVTISLDNSDLFSSTKLTGSSNGQHESASFGLVDSPSIIYEFEKPLIVPARGTATFTYDVTIVQNPSVTMRNPSVVYARLFGADPSRRPPYPKALGGPLMLLGIYVGLGGVSRRRRILGLFMVMAVLVSELGCGGGGSTSLGFFTSTQQVASINSCGPLTVAGMPAFLSKISVPE